MNIIIKEMMLDYLENGGSEDERQKLIKIMQDEINIVDINCACVSEDDFEYNDDVVERFKYDNGLWKPEMRGFVLGAARYVDENCYFHEVLEEILSIYADNELRRK